MDIITRLLLKTNDFDANLNKAKGSVNSFQGGITSMAQTAGAGVMKFAGTLGIAIGATEGLMKSINSTQTTGDAFTKRIDEAKASVDSFFASLAMGNVDGFLTNLQNVIGKAGDLSVILDELATKSLFSNAELNNLMTEKRIQENIAKDRSRSDAERNAALEKARELQLKINKLQTGLAKTNSESAYSTLDAGIAKQGLKGNVARETWGFALKESNREHITNMANMYRQKQTQIDNAKEINGTTGRLMDTMESRRLQSNFNKWLKGANGKFSEFAYFFSEMDDSAASDIAKAMDLISKANSMKGAISDAELVINNTDAKINGSYNSNGGSGVGKPTPPPVGSLGDIDAELSKLNKKLTEATTMEARATVQATINELEQRKINIKVVVDQEAFKIKHGEMKGGELAAPGSIYEALQNNAGNKKGGSFDLRKELPNMKLPKFKSPIKKDDVDLNQQYADSLLGIGTAFGSMGQMASQFGEDGLSFALNSIGSIAQMIVQLQGLATAQGVASAMALPFPANLGAIATVIGTITSIFTSLPTFETGGIIPGASFSGDKVLARVNSGEMILNDGQQSNLFRLLNGGIPSADRVSAMPQLANLSRLITPSAESRQSVSIGFDRVRGNDILLSLNNTLKSKGKKPL